MINKALQLCVLANLFATVLAFGDDVSVASRTLSREPDYKGKPRYAAIVLGEDSNRRIWLAEDGKELYVDRNANGDLTDDGPSLTLSKVRTLYLTVSPLPDFDGDYGPLDLAPIDGRSHRGLIIHRSRRHARDQTSLSVTIDGWLTMHSKANSFWGNSPGTARVIHVSDKLSPRLLRITKYEIGVKPEFLAIGFTTPRVLPDAPAIWMGTEGLPKEFPIVVRIRWPTESNAEPVETSHRLTERCCGHLFYTTTFELPANVVEGTAIADVEMPLGFAFPLATNQLQIPVVSKPVPVVNKSRFKLID
jgi:hypothetical protein